MVKKAKTYSKRELAFASMHARNEADRWRISAQTILKDLILNREAYVLFLYSSELYLKCLLMFLNVDVINNKSRNLYNLYNQLPDKKLKKAIKECIEINPLPLYDENDEFDNSDKVVLNNFEDFMKYISNGFIYYRYEYEKFLKQETITWPNLFIVNLNNALYKISNNLIYESINQNGK